MGNLPRLMLVSNRGLMRPDFLDAISAAVEGGARLIQLREKEIAHDELLALSRAAKTVCEARGAQLLMNDNEKITREIGAGLHLPETRSVAHARCALGREYFVGQSTHSLAAALRAQDAGADYIIFGSIFPTASHPGSTPAGVAALRVITHELEIPVFAIGGISLQNCAQCLEAGAHGVAMMRAVWQAADIAKAVSQFNVTLDECKNK